jgi:CRP-like cAMP-binding protein
MQPHHGRTRPTTETLRGVQLFTGLTPAERERIAQYCWARPFAPGEEIVAYGDQSRDVFFIVSGMVRATIYSRSGKEVTFRDLTAGQFFGDLAAIDGKPRAAAIVAASDSFVVSMSAEHFWEVLSDHPPVAATLLRELTSLVRLLTERIFEFSTLGVQNRIHAELLRLAQEHMRGDNTAEISPAPTHSEIAARVSTHREAVTRELNKLSRAGLIARKGRLLVIKDVARLGRMVAEVIGH